MPRKTNIKRNQKANFIGITLVVLSAIGFAMLGILAKVIYAENVSVEAVLSLRMLMSLIVIWLYIILFHNKKRKKENNRISIFIYLSAGFFGFYLSAFGGLQSLVYISVGLGVILYNTFPAMVIIITAFIEKKLPPLKEIIVLVLTQIGIFLVLGGAIGSSSNLIYGVVFALISALSGAIYILINQKISARIDTIYFVARALLFSTIFAFIHFLFKKDFSEFIMSGKAYIFIFISGACLTISYIFLTEGIKLIGASKASLINSVSPIFAVIFAFLILGEVLTIKQIIGGIIILLAILLLKKRSLVILRKKKLPGM